jgi:hypothetical protein
MCPQTTVDLGEHGAPGDAVDERDGKADDEEDAKSVDESLIEEKEEEEEEVHDGQEG